MARIIHKQLLEGKNCVVTAGAHGLGYAISRLFAQHGARVAICGQRPTGEMSAAELRKISPDSFFIQCDLGNTEAVGAFGREVLQRMEHVDVLVNCVGINEREPVCDIRPETFDRIMAVNFKAALKLTQLFVPVMMKKHIRGSVVNISSIHSVAPSAIMGSYAASKGALNAISRVLAEEVGKYGIRVNTLCCGWIATTPIFRELNTMESREQQHSYLERIETTTPLLSPARAEDIARHVLFFASDMSSYITGSTIMDDGGASIQTHYADFPRPADSSEIHRMFYDSILDSEYTRC